MYCAPMQCYCNDISKKMSGNENTATGREGKWWKENYLRV
jgi:hypothetical protein